MLQMSDPSTLVTIPNRSLFKASEVCELVKVQPYVLRSWESEFATLGVSKSVGASRVYRREDVEQVLKIKHLLLVEGLTLAGVRRRLEEETAGVAADVPVIDELIGQNARERLTEVKRGLRSILELLAHRGSASGGRAASHAAAIGLRRPRAAVSGKAARGKPAGRHRPAASRKRTH